MFWIDEQLCVGCGQCVRNCNVAAITLTNGIAHINQTICVQCGVCVEACPVKAIAERPAEHAETSQTTCSSNAAQVNQTEPDERSGSDTLAQVVNTVGKVVMEGLRWIGAKGGKGKGGGGGHFGRGGFRGGR